MNVKHVAAAVFAATLVLSDPVGAKSARKMSSRPQFEDVRVGVSLLRIPYPRGFCKPTGEDAASLQVATAGDSRNVTLLALIECDRSSGSNAYLLVKAPVRSLNETYERDVAIRELAAVMDESFEDTIADRIKSAAEDRSDASGIPTKIAGTYRPRGHDEICVYLGGPVTTTIEEQSEVQAIATCMTVVGSRLINLNAYEDSDDPEAYQRLLPKLKNWALEIAPRPGK